MVSFLSFSSYLLDHATHSHSHISCAMLGSLKCVQQSESIHIITILCTLDHYCTIVLHFINPSTMFPFAPFFIFVLRYSIFIGTNIHILPCTRVERTPKQQIFVPGCVASLIFSLECQPKLLLWRQKWRVALLMVVAGHCWWHRSDAVLTQFPTLDYVRRRRRPLLF